MAQPQEHVNPNGVSSCVAPTEAYAYEDAVAAWDYIAKVAPGRQRYIVGHSLGGAIATELARRRPDAAGLVLEATFTSVRDMIDHSPWGFLPVGLILTQNFDTLAKEKPSHSATITAVSVQKTLGE